MTIVTKQMLQDLYITEQKIDSIETILSPFAMTDLFIQDAAKSGHGILHFWETHPLVILGMKDTRVPNLAEGLKHLKSLGYHTIARNSGGLAVISEPGTLNLSIIIPNNSEQPMSVTAGYQLMTDLIQKSFAAFTDSIEAKEIPDSYCPGDFDLSIDGKKFAGISQRRIGNGLAVMIYLSVNGDQNSRGNMIRDFYQLTLKDDFGKNGYPPVNPSSMANISDLVNPPFTISEIKTLLSDTAEQLFNVSPKTINSQTYLERPETNERYQKHLLKMKNRNQEILPEGGNFNDTL